MVVGSTTPTSTAGATREHHPPRTLEFLAFARPTLFATFALHNRCTTHRMKKVPPADVTRRGLRHLPFTAEVTHVRFYCPRPPSAPQSAHKTEEAVQGLPAHPAPVRDVV